MDTKELRFEDLPEILPAYEDGIFQAMLTLPEAKTALISFVSTFLGRKVKSVRLRNNVTPKRDKYEKEAVYDISCIVDEENGEQCEIEMQASPMRNDNLENEHINIRWRSAFNLCKLHSLQYGRGKPYSDFTRSYQIMLCNYRVFSREQALVEHFTLKNKDGNELCDAITSIFVDLTKAKEIIKKPIYEMSEVEMWVAFIAFANDLRYVEVIKGITQRMEGIAVANVTLQSISQDEDERIYYYRRSKALQDEEHNKAVMKQTEEEMKQAEADKKQAEADKKQAEADKKQAFDERDSAFDERDKAFEKLDSVVAELADTKAELAELRAMITAMNTDTSDM
jgi:hypothetical protein